MTKVLLLEKARSHRSHLYFLLAGALLGSRGLRIPEIGNVRIPLEGIWGASPEYRPSLGNSRDVGSCLEVGEDMVDIVFRVSRCLAGMDLEKIGDSGVGDVSSSVRSFSGFSTRSSGCVVESPRPSLLSGDCLPLDWSSDCSSPFLVESGRREGVSSPVLVPCVWKSSFWAWYLASLS